MLLEINVRRRFESSVIESSQVGVGTAVVTDVG